jgi:hypothetical protein
VATKRGKSSGPVKRSVTPKSRPVAKKGGRPAPPSRTQAVLTKAAAPAVKAAPVRRAAAAVVVVTLLERAERLRDDILRSKTTHPDPWGYTAKARGWGQRAQALVDELASRGDSAQLERSVETLTAEVTGDRDFQAARRLF